jgi:3-oxoacyl-[acyl-carrier-protein] synthase II
MEPVVVTGLGAVTPLGVGAPTLHERWSAGECGIRDGEGACADFDPKDFLSAKEARRADRFTQLALAACSEALADAGWERELPYAPERVGCVLGTGIGGIATLLDGHDTLRERGAQYVAPLSVPLMMSNAGAGALSMRHDLRGPSFAITSACASGAHAIGSALRMLQNGEADAVLTGGSEAPLTPLARAAFGALDALSETGISRPFDARRDGFVMAEGAAVLVLERADGAAQRGARVRGTVRGYAASSDAHHLTAPREDGAGQAAAIRAVLLDAGLAVQDIDYINAHGTSTQMNDSAETRAVKAAFGPQASTIPMSSTKSMHGHLLGAAGAVEAVITILAIRDQFVPPTINLDDPDPECDLDYVPNHGRDARIDFALSTSYGFGGHNVCLALARADGA